MRRRGTDKDPGFYYFPGDWLKDAGVQSLTYEGKGIWWELLNIMASCSPPGALALRGRPMTTEEISNALHLTTRETEYWLALLLDKGIASRNTPDAEDYVPTLPTDTIFNRRMVRDAIARQQAVNNGRKGGNPALIGKHPAPAKPQPPEGASPPAPAGDDEGFWRKVLGQEYVHLKYFPALRKHPGEYEAVHGILKRVVVRSKEWEGLGAFVNKCLGRGYPPSQILGALNRLFEQADLGKVNGDYYGYARALLTKPDVHERELKKLVNIQRSGTTPIADILGGIGHGHTDEK